MFSDPHFMRFTLLLVASSHLFSLSCFFLPCPVVILCIFMRRVSKNILWCLSLSLKKIKWYALLSHTAPGNTESMKVLKIFSLIIPGVVISIFGKSQTSPERTNNKERNQVTWEEQEKKLTEKIFWDGAEQKPWSPRIIVRIRYSFLNEHIKQRYFFWGRTKINLEGE